MPFQKHPMKDIQHGGYFLHIFCLLVNHIIPLLSVRKGHVTEDTCKIRKGTPYKKQHLGPTMTPEAGEKKEEAKR